MQKIYPYWQGRIYMHIFQITWQCKQNFHKSNLGISKKLFFLFNYIVESSVNWFLRKQSKILWKCINFTPIDYIPLKAPKIKILENEKICWRYHHFTHVHQKSQSYDVRFLRFGVKQTKNFVNLGHFLLFYLPPNNLEYNNFEKNEKYAWRYYPFTHTCSINEDHMLYGSWNIRCNRHKSLTFWAIFLPFQPLDNLENQNFNIEKHTWRYHLFPHFNHKRQSYDIWFLRYGAQQT